MPDRQDAQHVDDAPTLHLDHDFEELQFARRSLRGHGLVIGKPAVMRRRGATDAECGLCQPRP